MGESTVIDNSDNTVVESDIGSTQDLEQKEQESVEESVLSTKDRKALPSADFALSGDRYPIPDESHARNALARGAQELADGKLSSAEYATIKRKVKAKFPDIKVSEASVTDIEGTILADKRIQEAVTLLEAQGESGSEWDVVLISPGLSQNRTFYSESTLRNAEKLFEGVSCFADHNNPSESRSVRDVVGWYDKVKYREGAGVTATFHALESTPWFLGPLKEAYNRGKSDLIGFSINGEGTRRLSKVDGSLAYMVESIDKIDSVDAVISPSAGGKVVRLIASQQEEELQMLDNLSLDELKAARPDLINQMLEEAAAKSKTDKKPKTDAEDKAEGDTSDPATDDAEDKADEKNMPPWMKKKKGVKEQADESADEADEKAKSDKLQEQKIIEDKVKQESAEMTDKLQEQFDALEAGYKKLQEEAAISRTQAKVQEMLAASPLPKSVHSKIAKRFEGKAIETEQIQEEIDSEKDIISALFDERPNSVYHDIQGGMSSLEKATKALDGMLSGKAVDGVRPARGIKEAYAMFKSTSNLMSSWDVDPWDVLQESTGGYRSWDRFKEGSSDLRESVSAGSQAYGAGGTPTWVQLLGDSITRKMLRDYAEAGYDEWRQVVSSVIPVQDFRTQRRMRLGGYDSLISTVAEGATYSPLTSPADEEATYFVKKYGNTDDITLEVIANDDVGAVRQLPTKLARVAKISLFIFVFNLVRVSTAPLTTYDGVSLYNTTHANSASAALTDAALSTAKVAMRTQTVYNVTSTGADYLGMRNLPKFLVIPTSLYPTADRLMRNEYTLAAPANPAAASYSQSDVNIHRNTLTPIVVDYWTTASWYLLGDPAQANTIEMGFFNGREEPELFTQSDPLVGTAFTNDKITYKIRHIYGGTPLDHRAFYYSGQP